MKKISFLLIGLIILTSMGCARKVSGDEKTAAEYIKAKGYKITEYKGETKKYTLEKSMLNETFFEQMWGVQKVEPDEYFGKEIVLYDFTVKNHPVEKIYKECKSVSVCIMLSEGKVIGGTSFPIADEHLFGGCYSLDGKTLEEVTGLDFQQWRENWTKKYSN